MNTAKVNVLVKLTIQFEKGADINKVIEEMGYNFDYEGIDSNIPGMQQAEITDTEIIESEIVHVE